MRFRIALLLIAMPLLTASSASTLAAQDTSDSPLDLTVHGWLCSPDIDRRTFDFAASCQETPLDSVEFELAEPRGAGNPDPASSRQSTDATGTATWDENWFGGGAFTLEADVTTLAALDVPIVDYVVGCSTGGETSALLDVEDFALSSVVLDIPEGTSEAAGEIICNWYAIPSGSEAGGNVTIQAVRCSGDAKTTCTEPASNTSLEVAFGPTGESKVIEFDDSGQVTFDTPAPSAALYLDTPMSGLSCAGDGEQPDPVDPAPPWTRAELDYTSLDVMGGDTVTCTLKVDNPQDS